MRPQFLTGFLVEGDELFVCDDDDDPICYDRILDVSVTSAEIVGPELLKRQMQCTARVTGVFYVDLIRDGLPARVFYVTLRCGCNSRCLGGWHALPGASRNTSGYREK
jgi:hypothetical protein